MDELVGSVWKSSQYLHKYKYKSFYCPKKHL